MRQEGAFSQTIELRIDVFIDVRYEFARRQPRVVVHGPENFRLALEAVFDYPGDDIVLARDALPSMLTLDVNAVRLDCLCYLMQRIDRRGRAVP